MTDQDWKKVAASFQVDLTAVTKQLAEARSMTEHQWLLKVAARLTAAGCKSDGIVDSLDELIRERDEVREENARLREIFQEIASANGFDNIGKWARNMARKALAPAATDGKETL